MRLYSANFSSLLGMLISLAKHGALYRWVETTTEELGKELGISQQTASRWLKKLSTSGLIVYKRQINGTKIQITPKGKALLESLFNELWIVLRVQGHEERYQFKGIVTTGLGEGRYYMSLKGYVSQFMSIFGFKPYPGTLNLQVDNADALLVYPKEIISGFTHEGRRFGDVYGWRCVLQTPNGEETECAVIRPARTHHTEVVEIIAKDNLRKKYNLKDGDECTVKIY